MIKRQLFSLAAKLCAALFIFIFFSAAGLNAQPADKTDSPQAATTLTPGDIAIVGYITNGSPDSFSFVNFVTLGSGTVIYFSDNGWTGTGFRGVTGTDADGNENLIRFTANNDIPVGTVIRSTDTSPNFTWTTSGAIGAGGSYTNLSLGQSGEQIAAVQSSSTTNPLFSGFTAIYQIDNTGAFENATDSVTGNVITGLSQAANTATLFNNTSTYAAYNLSTLASGTRAQYLAAISNSANWTFNNTSTVLPTGTIVNTAPTIVENTASPRINLPALAGGALSGVIGDSTNPTVTLGVDFTINDAETSVNSLTVTAASGNQTVVPNANLNLTGSGAARNLKITPAAVGYATITVTVSDGTATGVYTINYAASSASGTSGTTLFYTGASDASTALAVDANYMFVADDENQALRLYDRLNSGAAVSAFDFTSSLGLLDLSGGLPREVDIESSAQIGNRIYWLGSHSNAASGNTRPNRSRLFAADLSGAGATAALTYVGRFDNLKIDLIAWDANNTHGLGANYFGLQASAATGIIPEAPDGSGFNIEGLTLAPDNTTGYICFRAPLEPTASRTMALIIPVTNFTALVTGNPTAVTATFGTPILLNLGGRGIREIKKNAANEYLIIAGPPDAATGTAPKNFRLFTWTGNAADTPIGRDNVLSALNTGGSFESIVEIPASLNSATVLTDAPAAAQIQLLTDNGDTVFYGDGVAAKDLPNNEQKKFRSDVVTLGVITAASVSVGGRVTNAFGRGIARTRVTATNANDETRTATTNFLGYYRFEDVPAGETYTFNIASKNYIFAPQILSISSSIEELNFSALP